VIYTVKSPLTKTTGHYTAQQLYAAFEPMIPVDQREAARRLIDRIVVLCKALNLDEVAVAAIVWIETGAPNTGLPFRSEWWRNGYNAGNLGITGDPNQNASAQTWNTPEAAADGLMAHVVAYAYGSGWRTVWDVDELGQPQTHDKRFDLVLREYGGARLNSLEALNGKWAWDVDGAYDRKLAERANKLLSLMDDPPVDVPTTPEEPVEEEPPVAELQFGRVPMFTFTDRQAQMARKPEGVGWDNLGKRNPKFIALHRIWGNLWIFRQPVRPGADRFRGRRRGRGRRRQCWPHPQMDGPARIPIRLGQWPCVRTLRGRQEDCRQVRRDSRQPRRGQPGNLRLREHADR
jgi:hypothetical protein